MFFAKRLFLIIPFGFFLLAGDCQNGPTPPPPTQKGTCAEYSASDCAKAAPLSGKTCEVANGICRDAGSTPPPPPPPPPEPVDFLTASSVVDGSSFPNFDDACTAANKPLYRANTGSFVTLARVLKIMLGDELEELPSRRLSKMTTAADKSSVEKWNLLKQNALKIFLQDLAAHEATWVDPSSTIWGRNYTDYGPFKKCVLFAQDSEDFTWEDQPVAVKDKSWGMATISDYVQTLQYAGDPVDTNRRAKTPGEFTIIEIVERVPRAGLLSISRRPSNKGNPSGSGLYTRGGTWPGEEYYIPIVIPAADISQAWSRFYVGGSHSHGLEKVIGFDGQLIEVRISQELGKAGTDNGFPFAPQGTRPRSSVNLDGRVVPCAGGDPCISDSAGADLELKQIVDAIPAGKFKFVKEF